MFDYIFCDILIIFTDSLVGFLVGCLSTGVGLKVHHWSGYSSTLSFFNILFLLSSDLDGFFVGCRLIGVGFLDWIEMNNLNN